MEHAAIILAAGKGTRMGSAPVNKVAFDCAGVPVIRRIVRNMRAGGVTRFVIVVGHRVDSVMRALDGEPDILWAYQGEQKGTGHAAACGLAVLDSIGFSGRVLISMGDKIVSPGIVRGLLSEIGDSAVHLHLDSQPRLLPMATIGVQPNPGNTSKGHVVVRDGRVLGIVEAKDIRRARENGTMLSLCGQSFAPDEVAATPYVNAALYAFDAQLLGEALKTLRPDNAQGELYLTDVVEWFAQHGGVAFYQAQPSELLTYSTKAELRAMSRCFLRRVSEIREVKSKSEKAKSAVDQMLLLSAFEEKYGDRPCIIASAPGRINLMGRHIEHRGGSTNYMATNHRMTFVVAPREDDIVHIANRDPAYPEAEFRIEAKGIGEGTAAWLDYLELPETKAELEAHRGHWLNYVKGAVLRFQAAADMPLCGMDILASGNIPPAAGLSSSSALVVATAEAIVALNELNLTTREFVDLCGEGEWYVGSRGGAGDHAAMKCARAGCITHLKFKPFEIGEVVPFPDGYSVLVVDSGEQAKKSEGARETFNARIRDYETALNEVKRHYPELPLAYFRDLAFLPEKDRVKALACLTGSVKGVATFGINECRRAEECLTLLKNHDYVALGEMMKASHDGDRLGCGEYECSTKKIDALCDRLNATPGVLGSQLVGAGLGGCVIALVERSAADSVLTDLVKDGYEAFNCVPSSGSTVSFA